MLGAHTSVVLPGASAQGWHPSAHALPTTGSGKQEAGSGNVRDDVEAVLVGQLLLQQKSQGVLDMNNVHGIGHRDIEQYNHPKKKHKL